MDFARKLTGNTSQLGFGPAKGLVEVLKGTEMAMRDGNGEGFAKALFETSLEPLVNISAKQKEEWTHRLRTTFDHLAAQEPTPKELAEYMKKEVLQLLSKTELENVTIGNDGILSTMAKTMPGTADKIKSIYERLSEPPLAPRPPGRPLNASPGRA